MQRRQAEFSAWEQQVAKQRNQGQFFQGLYEVDKDSKRESKKQIPKVDAAEVKVRIGSNRCLIQQTHRLLPLRSFQCKQVIQQPSVSAAAKQHLRSPFRLYIFSSLSLILASLVIAGKMQHQVLETAFLFDLQFANWTVPADLLSKEASPMLDLLYASLGLALLYTAWLERKNWQ